MFLPRVLEKKKPAKKSDIHAGGGTLSHLNLPGVLPREATQDVPANPQPTMSNQVIAQDQYSEGLIALLELSMTNHALWSSPELRKLAQTRSDGWLSLASLIRHSSFFCGLSDDEIPSEVNLAKALRSAGDGSPLEIQMSLSNNRQDGSGLYNIRRKDWELLKGMPVREWTEEDWDTRTAYVENIPPLYRSSRYKIKDFLETVLGVTRIEAISYPLREGSDEEDKKCKGFAFVVCSTMEAVEVATELWSWRGVQERLTSVTSKGSATQASTVSMRTSAIKCGFRVLSKMEWCKLRDEYLQHMRNLVTINATLIPQVAPPVSQPGISSVSKALLLLHPSPDTPREVHVSEPKPSDRLLSNYPRGCLSFIRHVHPDTNKTTLKAFLLRAFTSEDLKHNPLNYVDYNKGMDSCHIRLSHPKYAIQLRDFFSCNSVVQLAGLDDKGMPLSSVKSSTSARSVHVEIVTGTREDYYWEKVPEKVRQAAVTTAQILEAASPDTVERNRKDTKRRKIAV